MYRYYRYFQYARYSQYVGLLRDLSTRYIGTILTGKVFNEKFINNVFVKLLNPDENHNGYQFKTGLNVDFREFNPIDSCSPGGLHFTEFDKMEMWIDNNDSDSDIYEPMVFCRKVTIPDDAYVYIEDNKFKADQFILGSRIPIKDLNFKDLYLEENGFLSPLNKGNEGNEEEQINEICITTIINYVYKTQTGC